MKNNKLNILIVCGGVSPEHKISVLSAKAVFNNLDKNKYNVKLVVVDFSGRWFLQTNKFFATPKNEVDFSKDSLQEVMLAKGEINNSGKIMLLNDHSVAIDDSRVDLVFPLIHGASGEDGVVQGFLEMLGIPCVGTSVVNAAITMDKDFTKKLLQHAGVLVVDYLTVTKNDYLQLDLAKVKIKIGYPCFIKPATTGSSVGVSKVKQEAELLSAIEKALQYGDKVLIEKFILAREIECGVLGCKSPLVSVPGELITDHDFYSYNAKYIDNEHLQLILPAKLTQEQTNTVQSIALHVFQVLAGQGMARVDFFLTDAGEWYLNEVNTVPGFTEASMFPRLWLQSGFTYIQLLDKLVELAMASKQSVANKIVADFVVDS